MTLQTLSIDSEDVLGTNYIVTSLTVSNYNPTIDSTVTVTVTLKDVYNDPVVGEEVLVTASEGNFTQLNGSDITSASSVTGTTNSSGQFTLTYNCSVWGLITFVANNTSKQVSVTGWKQVQTLASDKVKVVTDGKNAKIRIGGTFTTSTSAGEFTLATIDSAYQPDANYVTNYSVGTTNFIPVYLKSDNSVVYIYKGSTSSSSVTCYCTLFYPLKTPLY